MSISEYYTPTHVLFGQDAESKVAEELEALKVKKVLVHFGGKSAVRSGLIKKITDLLDAKGIKYELLGGVKPNPRIELAREALELCRRKNIDFVLAVGGGSVIDSAKAICYGIYNGGDPWDFYSGARAPKGSAGLGVVLTLAAAGSEMSDSSVLTNEELGLKRGCNTNYCRAKFALMNPELTYTLPPYQISCGTVDIAMHTIERFFHAGKGIGITDALAGSLIRTVFEKGASCLENPLDYESHASLMWASSLSHNGLMALGNDTKGDWACHQLEHELSGMFDIAHGAGLAIVFPAWSRFVSKEKPARFAELGKAVFGIDGEIESACDKTIGRFQELFRSLDMPLSLKEAGIEPSEEQIKELAKKCSFFSTRKIGNFRVLDEKDMETIYRMML